MLITTFGEVRNASIVVNCKQLFVGEESFKSMFSIKFVEGHNDFKVFSANDQSKTCTIHSV